MNWWQVAAVCAAILWAGHGIARQVGVVVHNLMCAALDLGKIRECLQESIGADSSGNMRRGVRVSVDGTVQTLIRNSGLSVSLQKD
jgi:hypothetical protein